MTSQTGIRTMHACVIVLLLIVCVWTLCKALTQQPIALTTLCTICITFTLQTGQLTLLTVTVQVKMEGGA